MTTVPVQIVCFVLEHQPNIVGCVLTDAFGRQWSFEDKVVLFTDAYLDESSRYPHPGAIPCKVVRDWTDENGRQIATIDTTAQCAIEAITGETQFDVLAHQLSTSVA